MITEMRITALFFIFPANTILTGILPVIAVVLPRYIIDAITNADTRSVWIYVSLFAGVSMLFALATETMKQSVQQYFMEMRLYQFVKYHEKYKDAAYSALENPDFQAKRYVAMNTLSNANRGFQGAYHNIYDILPNVVTIILFIVILGIINPIIIVVACLAAILQFYLHLRGKRLEYENKEELADADRKSKYFYNTACDFSYGKDIRMNGYRNKLSELQKERSSIYQNLFRKFRKNEYRYGLFDLLFALATNGTAYYFVIRAYFNGLITIGEMSMTIWTVLAITLLLQRTATKVASLIDSTKYTAAYLEFMDTESYFPKNGESEIKDESLTIDFLNVSFKYPSSEEYVLKNLSLHIDSHQRLALVGLNGSGKTTLVKLLSGLYKPTEGKILVNGKNIEDLDMNIYIQRIAVVFQDVNIYAATIQENLIGTSKQEIEVLKANKALDEVDLSEKINQLPKQQQTQMLKIIDSEGIELSGGESQKLAIARALVKDHSRLIVLDEPTSSLDAIAERELYEKFEGLIRKRTAIIISHRLASTRFCDKVAFLKNGELTEFGSHEELMNQPTSEYRNMFLVQGKYYREDRQNETIKNL